MPRKYLITMFAVAFLVYGIVFTILDSRSRASGETTSSVPIITPDAQTIEKAKAEFLAKICAGHGGVNCSMVNRDASIVCNDGTIDGSLSTIYAVPKCQKTLEALADQESDFMAESGCFPPSEMACINETSYKNLFNHLNTSGLAYSELGKNELAQCRKDITDYNRDNKNYRQCLVNNGRPDFELSGKQILPILKAVFCPLFYGNKSSYDSNTDLCLCDTGYFLHNNQCVKADRICQEKYGPRASAKNGNCVVSSTTSTFIKSLLSPKTSQPKDNMKPPETVLRTPVPSIKYLPQAYSSRSQASGRIPEARLLEGNRPAEEPKRGFVQNIIGSIISGIKNMLKLF